MAGPARNWQRLGPDTKAEARSCAAHSFSSVLSPFFWEPPFPAFPGRHLRLSAFHGSRTWWMSRACGTTCWSATAWSSASIDTGDSLQNVPFTRAFDPGHARTAGRQYQRQDHADQERRRGHGHGQASRLRRQQARISTCRFPPWATPRTFQGGTLLVTPLMGADGQVYALAQGPRRHRRLFGPGRGGKRHARRAHRRTHRQRRHRGKRAPASSSPASAM